MKITKRQLKQIIKEEIEEARGVPSPEYHDIATSIGRGPRWPGDKRAGTSTQGPALPGEIALTAQFLNNDIPAWLGHTDMMLKDIRNSKSDLVKTQPGITHLIEPIQNFRFHVQSLQKNLEQDKPVRRHAMGMPISNDYVEVPTENEEDALKWVYQQLARAYAEGYAMHDRREPDGISKSRKQPNYMKVAKTLKGALDHLIGGREKSTWPGAHRGKDPKTGLTHGPIGYSAKKDAEQGPHRYPQYRRENLMKITKSQLKQIIKEEMEEALKIGGERFTMEPPKEPAKEILKHLTEKLSEVGDIDTISEEQAMDILDVVIDSMQEIFHLGGFGTQSPVEEKKKYKKSFYKAKDDRADLLKSKGVDPDIAYGVADKQMAAAGKKKKRGKK